MGQLEGRVAVVTGGVQGIGEAYCRRFAEEGASIVIGDIQDDKGPPAVAALEAKGAEAAYTHCDVTRKDEIDALMDFAVDRFGRLDIVIGNAGLLGTMGPITHLEPKVWEEVMTVNVSANWRMIRSFDPLLRQSDAGRALYFSSAAARGPRAYWSVYAVSKAALEMTALIYAAEVEKTAVRVNLINPGATRTAMRAQAFPGEDPEGVKTPESTTDLFVELAEANCARNGELVQPV